MPGAEVGQGCKGDQSRHESSSSGSLCLGVERERQTNKIDKYIYRLWEMMCREEVRKREESRDMVSYLREEVVVS